LSTLIARFGVTTSRNDCFPPIRYRAVILNWSERKRWRFSLASIAFRHFGGHREFNPLAVVFRPFRPTRKFRFWPPFREFKQGNAEPLRHTEQAFFSLIGVPRGKPAVLPSET
jgi:hypothetical protein